MSYVLCRAYIGLLLSEKEVILEFFWGLLPENGDVERKRYFWNFIVCLFYLSSKHIVKHDIKNTDVGQYTNHHSLRLYNYDHRNFLDSDM